LVRSFIVLGTATWVAGCHGPSSVTSREHGETDATGRAVVHAVADGANHHYTAELALRDAAPGTYALVFSSTALTAEAWTSVAADEPALACALAFDRGCQVLAAGQAEIVAATRVGPGGAGILRASFDVGAGGWFSLVRIERGDARPARFELRFVSEALSKDERAYAFTFERAAKAPAPSVLTEAARPAS
jgi:hypothetical protein